MCVHGVGVGGRVYGVRSFSLFRQAHRDGVNAVQCAHTPMHHASIHPPLTTTQSVHPSYPSPFKNHATGKKVSPSLKSIPLQEPCSNKQKKVQEKQRTEEDVEVPHDDHAQAPSYLQRIGLGHVGRIGEEAGWLVGEGEGGW